MQRDKLIHKLNWFYSLEAEQVDLYNNQAKQTEDPFLRQVLYRVAAIEQQHVRNIGEEIVKQGASPTIIGDVLAHVIGRAAGRLTGEMGPSALLRLNIMLEEKAMSEYSDLIGRVSNDAGLTQVLRQNLIDEDLHTKWFMSKLKDIAETKNYVPV